MSLREGAILRLDLAEKLFGTRARTGEKRKEVTGSEVWIKRKPTMVPYTRRLRSRCRAGRRSLSEGATACEWKDAKSKTDCHRLTVAGIGLSSRLARTRPSIGTVENSSENATGCRMNLPLSILGKLEPGRIGQRRSLDAAEDAVIDHQATPLATISLPTY